MRYGITWTTTHHSEVDLSVEQLAAWATTAAPGAFFAQSPEALAGTSAEQLVELISRTVTSETVCLPCTCSRPTPPTRPPRHT